MDGWMDGWIDGWMDGWMDGAKWVAGNKKLYRRCNKITRWGKKKLFTRNEVEKRHMESQCRTQHWCQPHPSLSRLDLRTCEESCARFFFFFFSYNDVPQKKTYRILAPAFFILYTARQTANTQVDARYTHTHERRRQYLLYSSSSQLINWRRVWGGPTEC